MREAYAREADKRKGDKQAFLNPKVIVIACVLIVGFVLFIW
jgi:hypothetical protein